MRKYIDRAQPDHPSLIDQAHVLDELLGIVNVPMGVWIDEAGIIVRPPEPAWPGQSPVRDSLRQLDPATLPPHLAEMMTEVAKIRTSPEAYLAAVYDWVEHGSASRFALAPDEVVRRSQPRSREVALAAAHFELGQHLHREGHHDAAIPHFRQAHRLQPDNWTYKRQAWNFEDPVVQGPTDVYEGNWLADVKKIGAENYYAPFVP